MKHIDLPRIVAKVAIKVKARKVCSIRTSLAFKKILAVQQVMRTGIW